ncbi:hypothetical protein KC19_VG094800 [Ceratodon purpureus]|uniref:Uncharacterized protein n=1 Tax=Ceratodon purpureus TaxID=3225 RepID=A0A8T0HNU6_CERPU|nr:hypothetical protein KC19_VG094800 [Ceratodon purpureus]
MKHRWNIKLKRVQACSRRTNVARVPSLLPLRARGEMSFCAKFTSAVVLGAMGISGVSIYDDYLIFQQVSKKALAKANVDSEFKAIVGENIDQGPWYEASMTVDHEGHSAACSFPVSGSLCSANIHLRAVRYEETNSFASYFVLPGSGEWELVVLEALMHRPGSGDQQNPERIDLLKSDEAAPGCAR